MADCFSFECHHNLLHFRDSILDNGRVSFWDILTPKVKLVQNKDMK